MSQQRTTLSARGIVDRLRGGETLLSRDTDRARTHSRVDDLVQALRNDARYASAYERLHSSLELIALARSGGRILITSAKPGEGKSTVVTTLAIAVTLAWRRVLVVDADLRCPTLHQLFELPNHRGLANVLSGECNVSDVLQTVDIQAGSTPTRALTVITSGAVSPESVHLLGSPRMAAAVGELQGRFDFVLFDSPPVLPVNDAIVLATVADMVLLVMQAGETAEYDVRRARQRLDSSAHKIVGSVLTRLDTAGEEDGSYQYPYGPNVPAD